MQRDEYRNRIEAEPFALAKPWFKKMLDLLESENAHQAARRNIVRLFQFTDIPKQYQGRLMNDCFGFIEDPEEAIAVNIRGYSPIDYI